MKTISPNKNKFAGIKWGMTLIEVILYTTLLSFLMATTIEYIYTIQIRNASLLDSINYEENH